MNMVFGTMVHLDHIYIDYWLRDLKDPGRKILVPVCVNSRRTENDNALLLFLLWAGAAALKAKHAASTRTSDDVF